MNIDLLSLLIGSGITALTSFLVAKYQIDYMIKLEIKKLKWDRYSEKLFELSENVSKAAFVIPKHIDKEDVPETYIEDLVEVIGISKRWIHYKDLSKLLKSFEDDAFDALVGHGGNLVKERRDQIVQSIPIKASQIQTEIDKIFDV